MLSKTEIDRKFAARVRVLKTGTVTPLHSAAEAGLDAEGTDDAEVRRDRVQHEADPYLHEAPRVAEVDLAELDKAYRQAFDTPSGYPPMRPVDAEQFRRPLVTAGHEANSPGYAPPGQAVPVPSATLAPGMITRPLLADGQSRPCAPEAC